MSGVSRAVDRVGVTSDDETLVADAGLIVPATLMVRLGLEVLIDQMVRLVGRVGGARPGRKVLTLVAEILAGGSHIDHADKLRAGATEEVLLFRVMAPSTLGTFLRAFTFGHVRQLEAVIGEAIRRAWLAGAGPGDSAVTIDVDSTICQVHGKHKPAPLSQGHGRRATGRQRAQEHQLQDLRRIPSVLSIAHLVLLHAIENNNLDSDSPNGDRVYPEPHASTAGALLGSGSR